MNSKIIAFPVSRATKVTEGLPRRAAGTIISLERWKQRAKLHRTANGIFFMSDVLMTPGDFA
ncbi:MAG TPA: hypothetical protein DEO85_05920 [Maritimibacter sp.]|nr:hypothetical protein [Maritimibacter sp.]